jgi:hypothetical protein
MLNYGKDVAAILQSLEIGEATYQRWQMLNESATNHPAYKSTICFWQKP